MKRHMHRKEILKSALTGLAAAPLLGASSRAQDTTPSRDDASIPTHGMSRFPANWTRPDEIIMVLYPGFTALDLIGPQYFFGSLMGSTVHLAAKEMAPVRTDTGVSILPLHPLSRLPGFLRCPVPARGLPGHARCHC